MLAPTLVLSTFLTLTSAPSRPAPHASVVAQNQEWRGAPPAVAPTPPSQSSMRGYPVEAPPPPPREVVAPRAGFVWISGHHEWRNGRYFWIGGVWEREQPGRRWQAGRWERQGDRYVWFPGAWVGAAPPPPPPPQAVYIAPPPPPPPLPPETQDRSPGDPNQIWIPGAYEWRGDRYVFVRGRWDRARPGRRWNPGHWDREGDRNVWRQGDWGDEARRDEHRERMDDKHERHEERKEDRRERHEERRDDRRDDRR
jgi:hypothetical protein